MRWSVVATPLLSSIAFAGAADDCGLISGKLVGARELEVAIAAHQHEEKLSGLQTKLNHLREQKAFIEKDTAAGQLFGYPNYFILWAAAAPRDPSAPATLDHAAMRPLFQKLAELAKGVQ